MGRPAAKKPRRRRLKAHERRLLEHDVEIVAVITCEGACGDELEGRGMDEAEARADLEDWLRRKEGWTLDDEYGALCPECVELKKRGEL